MASLTREDVIDHYALYGLVSAIAAERAAVRLTEQQLDELERINEVMGEELRSDTTDYGLLEQLNNDFHRRLISTGSSDRLRAVLRVLARGIPSSFYEFTEGSSEEAHSAHNEILAALRARDGAASGAAMVRHLRASGELCAQHLERQGFWARSSPLTVVSEDLAHGPEARP